MQEVFMLVIEFATSTPFYARKQFVVSNAEEVEKLKKLVLDGNGRVVFVEPYKMVTADEAAKLITNEAREWLKSMGEL